MILSTAYLPPIEYFQKIVSVPSTSIERHEHFIKQTYRNRCYILGANGLHILSIPLINTHEKTLISEKKISYTENWQKQHWRTIRSAYANSPYFIYYEDELKPFYENQFEFLFDYNTELLKVLLNLLKLQTAIQFTEIYQDPYQMLIRHGEQHDEPDSDFRNAISPKNKNTSENFKPYSQVFSDKHSFVPNLSIIDLLFNMGPEAKEFIV